MVRATANAKFGDYSATVAMPLAKQAGQASHGRSPKRSSPGSMLVQFFDCPIGDPVGPGFINLTVREMPGPGAACG